MSRVTCLLFAMLAVVTFAPEAHAFKPAPPQSYSVVTKDGRFVFVMLTTKDFVSVDSREGAALRGKYQRSGLYRNDGTVNPLWTVDWYSWRVFPASDGVHLVRVERRAYL